jgi:hypothetical protein
MSIDRTGRPDRPSDELDENSEPETLSDQQFDGGNEGGPDRSQVETGIRVNRRPNVPESPLPPRVGKPDEYGGGDAAYEFDGKGDPAGGMSQACVAAAETSEQDLPSPEGQAEAADRIAESHEGLVEATLTDTFNATREWAIVELAKRGADLLHPGLGRLIDLSQRVAEAFHDATALDDSEGNRTLTVPLTQLAGFDVNLHVRLTGSADSIISAPPINCFAAPSGDSLFGGWAIEKNEQSVTSSVHTTAWSELDSTDLELPTTDISTDKAEPLQASLSPTWRWVKRRWVIVGALGIADLSRFGTGTEAATRAAILRYVARHYRDEVITRYPDDRLEVVVIEDPATGSGIWLYMDHSL